MGVGAVGPREGTVGGVVSGSLGSCGFGRAVGSRRRGPQLVPGSTLGRAALHPPEPGAGWEGCFGMSVSSCNALVWLPRRGVDSPLRGSPWDGIGTFTAAGKGKAGG